MPSLIASRFGPAVACVLLLASVVAPAPSVLAQPSAILQGSGTSVPAPVVPGTTGSLDLALRNVGNQSAFRMQASVVEADEGITVTGQSPASIGGLGPGGSTSVSPFGFEVPTTTSPGVYHVRIDVDYSYGTSPNQRSDTLTITVTITVRSPATLFIKQFEPDHFVPGTQASATIVLSNLGRGTFFDILGTWSSEGDVLLPLGGSNAFHVPEIGPGNSTVVPVEVSVKQGTVPGLYALTFRVQYRDGGGTTLNSTSTVGVRIEGEPGPQVQVSVQDVDEDTITLAATNVGTNPVTGVRVQFVPAPGQEVVGPDTAVLGNLAPGEFLTAKFDVTGSPADDGATAAVEIAYTDSAGTRRTETQTLGPIRTGSGVGDLLVTIQGIESDLLTLAVTNTGVTPVTGVRLRLAASPDLDVTGADTIAVGNLAPGEFKEAEFEVDLAGATDEPLSATVQVAYTDSDGDERASTQEVSREGIAPTAPPGAAATALFAGLIIIVLAGGVWGVVWLRKRRKAEREAAAREAQEAWERMEEMNRHRETDDQQGWDRP